jgi:hypothetical protein
MAPLRQHADIPDVAQSSFIAVSIDYPDFLSGHRISPSTQLSYARKKGQHVTSETQHHNREPNNGRGDGHGFNAEPFPHSETLAPTPRHGGLYFGIFRYKSGGGSRLCKI